MQVGGYTLHLYCDGSSCINEYTHSRYSAVELNGETAGNCRKQARRLGWKLSAGGLGGPDLCPSCADKAEK